MKKLLLEPYKLFFETLGNGTRWSIIHILQEKPYRVTAIVRKLRLEQSLISHHLRRLEQCGFVSFAKNGKERTYSLNKKTVKPLLALMDTHINTFCKHACVKCA